MLTFLRTLKFLYHISYMSSTLLLVSSSVIGKIRKNYKLGRLEHPGKKRQMTKRVLDKVNTSDEEVIRKIINDMIARRSVDARVRFRL